MARKRTERLLNLVIALLATTRPLTVAEIHRSVEGYPDEADEASLRAFERDKKELRDLGVPVETVVDPLYEDEIGYMIRRDAYLLPEVDLTPEEAAAIALAARFWRSEDLSRVVSTALLKLKAAGADVDAPLPVGLEPRIRTVAAFSPVAAAVRLRRPVRFRYRNAAATAVEDRHVQPWGVASRRGRWYLVGWDLDREDERVFRLDRIQGDVVAEGSADSFTPPSDLDLSRAIAGDGAADGAGDGAGDGGAAAGHGEHPGEQARLRVRVGAAYPLRRRAAAVISADDGHDLVELPLAGADFGALEEAAAELSGYGPDVVVLEPPRLREAVVDRLRAVLSAAGGHRATPGGAAE